MDNIEIINEEFDKFIKEYDDTVFKSKISNQTKKLSAKFEGRNITWYGTIGKTAILPMNQIDGMWGNIYNYEKIEHLVKKIESMDMNIELEASYCMPYIIDIQLIKEAQQDYIYGDYESDHEGMSKVLSTDDDELDNYVGSYYNFDDVDEISHVDSEFIKIIQKYHLDIALNKKSIQNFKKDLIHILKEHDLERTEAIEVYQYVKNMESKLHTALKEEWGDIGTIRFQLRDGHHRWKAAEKLGERYILCDIHDFDMNILSNYVTTL